MSDLYHEVILDQLKHPAHQGQLGHPSVVHSETNASCGDQITIYLAAPDSATHSSTHPSTPVFTWQGQGCAISQATMSLLASHVHDRTLTELAILDLNERDLLQLVGLSAINPGRRKCLQLGLRALQTAIRRGREEDSIK